MEVGVNRSDASRATEIAYLLVNLMLVLLVAGAVIAVVSTGVGLGRGGDTLLGGKTLSMEAKLPRNEIKSLPRGVVLTHDPRVTVEVHHPSDKQLLLSIGTAVGPTLLLAAALWLLRGLSGSVKAGAAFGAANVRRLRSLGLVLVVGAPLVAVVNWSLRVALANTLPSDTFGNADFGGFSFPFVPVLAGLGAFILAEVFAYGVSLREDVEATI
jgi:hypothetical protein